MSNQVNVSAEFMSFFGRNATKIEQAKQAEARLQNVPLPIGASGTAIVTGFKFDSSKDKQNPDGTTKAGTPYCEMTLSVIDNEQYQGKAMRKQWWFATSANMDAAGRYEMFLNDLERLGLPREIRTNHESPSDLGRYFLETQGLTFHFNIIENLRNTMDDFKELKLSTMETHIPSDDSVAPPMMPSSAPKDPAPAAPDAAPAPAPAAPAAPAVALPAVGSKVKHLEMDWEVKEVFATSGKVLIKGIDDPSLERITLASNLE
jgi:hypothetical protein